MMVRGFGRVRSAASMMALLLLLGQAAAASADGERAGRTARPPLPAAAAAPLPQTVAGARLLLDEDYFETLLMALDGARDEIALSMYLFRTIAGMSGRPEAVLERLAAAVRRGVRVGVILEASRDARDPGQINDETAARLRKAGVRVCMDSPDRVTHTKLVVIDRRHLLVGSHNWTQAGLKFNREASVWIDSAPLAGEALRYLRSICPEGFPAPDSGSR